MASVPDRRCHDRFYFSDGSLHLLVEDTLYCVHRYLFEKHASKFPACGTYSLREPYALENVKQMDFDRLLACLYPDTLLGQETKTVEEWSSILNLASKWGFESLRSRAIHKVKRTLKTPVDMVAFARQHDMSDILLPAYATLCQSNVPLTYEEGLRLGMKDVVDIYRIRHELHGSDATLVSFEDTIKQVEAFLSNEERKDDTEAETAKQRDAGFGGDAEASVWSDAGSGSSSRTPSAQNDGKLEVAISMARTSLPSPEMTITVGVENPDSEGSESEYHSLNAPFPNGTCDDSPELTRQGLELLDELSMDSFDVVSVNVLRWVNANDSQTLYHVTRLIVEKVVQNYGQIDPCVLLCKEMVKKVSGKVRDNKTKKSKCPDISGGPLFREYLGELCQKKLENVTASITAALTRNGWTAHDSLSRTTRPPEVQRLRLIRFIRQLSDLTAGRPEIIASRANIEKWVATLLDAQDEEKLVTLSMLLDSAGPHWDASTGKLKSRMNSCFLKMANIAQKTDNARLQTLLQDVIDRRNKGWVVNEARGSEDENDQPEVEITETSKGGAKRQGNGIVSACSKNELLNNERDWFGGTGNEQSWI